MRRPSSRSAGLADTTPEARVRGSRIAFAFSDTPSWAPCSRQKVGKPLASGREGSSNGLGVRASLSDLVMRMPRLKISLRTLMLLVVAFVLGMAADDVRHHHAPFMKRARYYELEGTLHREQLHEIEENIAKLQAAPSASEKHASELKEAKARREVIRELADRCDDLRAQFERASWIPFAPPPDDSGYEFDGPMNPITITVKSRSIELIVPEDAPSSDGPNP